MARTGYIDASNGLSVGQLVAALASLGVPPAWWQEALAAFGFDADEWVFRSVRDVYMGAAVEQVTVGALSDLPVDISLLLEREWPLEWVRRFASIVAEASCQNFDMGSLRAVSALLLGAFNYLQLDVIKVTLPHDVSTVDADLQLILAVLAEPVDAVDAVGAHLVVDHVGMGSVDGKVVSVCVGEWIGKTNWRTAKPYQFGDGPTRWTAADDAVVEKITQMSHVNH